MGFKHTVASAATMAALLGVAGTAQAAFEGRNASNAMDNTCTVSGATKCTSFYDTTLDITILNNWNIGSGFWAATAVAGLAQALAASAGLASTGLAGWVLPTGDGDQPKGAANQYLSIWNDAGGRYSGLSSRFDGVQGGVYYWSCSVWALNPDFDAWYFAVDGSQNFDSSIFNSFAVAVRPGDVAAAVPEPRAYAMVLLGLGTLMVALRRRARLGFGTSSTSTLPRARAR